jgi:hypothetical protein
MAQTQKRVIEKMLGAERNGRLGYSKNEQTDVDNVHHSYVRRK